MDSSKDVYSERQALVNRTGSMDHNLYEAALARALRGIDRAEEIACGAGWEGYRYDTYLLGVGIRQLLQDSVDGRRKRLIAGLDDQLRLPCVSEIR